MKEAQTDKDEEAVQIPLAWNNTTWNSNIF